MLTNRKNCLPIKLCALENDFNSENVSLHIKSIAKVPWEAQTSEAKEMTTGQRPQCSKEHKADDMGRRNVSMAADV